MVWWGQGWQRIRASCKPINKTGQWCRIHKGVSSLKLVLHCFHMRHWLVMLISLSSLKMQFTLCSLSLGCFLHYCLTLRTYTQIYPTFKFIQVDRLPKIYTLRNSYNSKTNGQAILSGQVSKPYFSYKLFWCAEVLHESSHSDVTMMNPCLMNPMSHHCTLLKDSRLSLKTKIGQKNWELLVV